MQKLILLNPGAEKSRKVENTAAIIFLLIMTALVAIVAWVSIALIRVYIRSDAITARSDFVNLTSNTTIKYN